MNERFDRRLAWWFEFTGAGRLGDAASGGSDIEQGSESEGGSFDDDVER